MDSHRHKVTLFPKCGQANCKVCPAGGVYLPHKGIPSANQLRGLVWILLLGTCTKNTVTCVAQSFLAGVVILLCSIASIPHQTIFCLECTTTLPFKLCWPCGYHTPNPHTKPCKETEWHSSVYINDIWSSGGSHHIPLHTASVATINPTHWPSEVTLSSYTGGVVLLLQTEDCLMRLWST